MRIKKEAVCVVWVMSFSLMTLEGMRAQRASSAPEAKSPALSVIGVGLSDDAVTSRHAPRPATSLAGERKSRSRSIVRGRVFEQHKDQFQSSSRSDSAVGGGSSDDGSIYDLRPTVRSVADHDRLGKIFSQWRYYVADQKALLLNKLMGPSIRLKALRGGLSGLRVGKRTEMAVLFCDIRNFTSITELNDPQNIMGMLNEYFGSIVKIISKNHGVVDKFIGDAVLAEFFFNEQEGDGEVISRTDVCKNAVESALEIINFTQTFDLAKFALRDDEEQHYLSGNRLQNGIGVTFGSVVFGALGSEDRCELTVIGDEVNLASRLQDLNKNPDISRRLERPLIISQSVRNFLSEGYKEKFISLGKQSIKGKKEKVDTFGYGKQASEEVAL